MKSLIILSVFTFLTAVSLYGQPFSAESKSSIFSINGSFNHASTKPNKPSELYAGVNYNKLLWRGLYLGGNLAFSRVSLQISPSDDSGVIRHLGFEAGPQLGYIFGKPDNTFYPFLKIGGRYGRINIAENGETFAVQSKIIGEPAIGLIILPTSNFGFTITTGFQFVSTSTEYEIDISSDSFNSRDFFVRFGVVGILN